MKQETAVKMAARGLDSLSARAPLHARTLVAPSGLLPTTGTVLMIGGHSEPPYPDDIIRSLLGRVFDNSSFERVAVDYPSNDGNVTSANAIGVQNLIRAIGEAAHPITVVGMSQGSMIVDLTLPQLTIDPKYLTAVVISDPNRPGGLTHAAEPPATPYNVVQVVGQYDGFTHWPRNAWNLLATGNALIGMGSTGGYSAHGEARWADLTQAAVTSWTNVRGGVTTRCFVRCPILPLIGRDNAWLRSNIDSAY